jgi:hypothetical protein
VVTTATAPAIAPRTDVAADDNVDPRFFADGLFAERGAAARAVVFRFAVLRFAVLRAARAGFAPDRLGAVRSRDLAPVVFRVGPRDPRRALERGLLRFAGDRFGMMTIGRLIVIGCGLRNVRVVEEV